MNGFKPRDQIRYMPDHAKDDITHPDCESGFVTSVRGNTIFCRFWNKFGVPDLRTRANSEGCREENLIHSRLVDDELVDMFINLYNIEVADEN